MNLRHKKFDWDLWLIRIEGYVFEDGFLMPTYAVEITFMPLGVGIVLGVYGNHA